MTGSEPQSSENLVAIGNNRLRPIPCKGGRQLLGATPQNCQDRGERNAQTQL